MFAVTITKAQGQTLKHVAIHSPWPVFPHGQHYVAFLQTSSFDTVSAAIIERH
jgi:hypothetical protein